MTNLPLNPQPQFATKEEQQEILAGLPQQRKIDVKKTIAALKDVIQAIKQYEQNNMGSHEIVSN